MLRCIIIVLVVTLVATCIQWVVPAVGKSERPVLAATGHGFLLEYVLHLVSLPRGLSIGHNHYLLTL